MTKEYHKVLGLDSIPDSTVLVWPVDEKGEESISNWNTRFWLADRKRVLCLGNHGQIFRCEIEVRVEHFAMLFQT